VVLLLTLAFFGFSIWLARVDLDQKLQSYDIHFSGSVAGLGVGGDVRYRGIKIGSVTSIAIDPDNPARVLTTVAVDGTTRLREGDVARLALQGITGIAAREQQTVISSDVHADDRFAIVADIIASCGTAHAFACQSQSDFPLQPRIVFESIETTVAKAVDEAVQRAGNAQRGLLAAALAMALERCDGAPGTQNQPE